MAIGASRVKSLASDYVKVEGRGLAEGSPAELKEAYRALSLEEVFIKAVGASRLG